MNTWARRASWLLLAIITLVIGGALVGKLLGERKMRRVITIAPAPFDLRANRHSLEQGRYLFATRGCADCHGANGAGREVIRSGAMLVVSPNITAGANSATSTYREIDWVRTLRHGVKPDGTPVMIMPSEDYNRLTDADLAAIITYARQLAPAAGLAAQIRLPARVKILYGFGVVRDAAEMIDHALAPQAPVAPAVSIAHGAYVAYSCMGCHGEHMSGGRIPGSPPEWPAPANLTPGSGSAMTRYRTPEGFMTMLRTGKRPDGTPISNVMPFGSLSQMSETDVRALHAFLHTLPPRPAGGR